MITVQIFLDLYEFGELKGKARNRALEEHRDFLLSTATDWEVEECQDDDWVIESIGMNDYMFFHDGELADVVNYFGSHPKAGSTEFIYQGRAYTLRRWVKTLEN